MEPLHVLARVDALFAERGGSEYFGEAVTQLEHALQCAWLAEQDAQPPQVIAAALLHDVGHLLHGHGEDYLDQGVDDRHEVMGSRFLAQGYGPAVTEPIRLHVQAKRFLAATRPGYLDLLSPASTRSLQLQGGPLTPEEVDAFADGVHVAAAVAVRLYDDRAKVVGLETPPYSHFHGYVDAMLRRG